MRKFEKKSEQVEIEGKIFTIKEVTPALALDYIEGNKSFDLNAVREILPQVSDVELDDLRGMTFSQIKGLYDVFREVNADFFAVIPLDKILAGYQETVLQIVNKNLSALSVQSLQPVTDPEPGTTDGDILSAA